LIIVEKNVGGFWYGNVSCKKINIVKNGIKIYGKE